VSRSASVTLKMPLATAWDASPLNGLAVSAGNLTIAPGSLGGSAQWSKKVFLQRASQFWTGRIEWHGLQKVATNSMYFEISIDGGLHWTWIGGPSGSTGWSGSQETVPVGVDNADNLIANPSVELGTSQYGNNVATVTRVNTIVPPFGSYELSIVTTNAASSGAIFNGAGNQTVPIRVTPGLPYTFSLYAARATAGSIGMRLRIEWLNSANSIIGVSTQDVTVNTTTWQRFQMTQAAPDGSVYANVAFYTQAASGVVTVYSDSWQFEQTPAANAYVDGDQPGGVWLGAPHASRSLQKALTDVDDYPTDLNGITVLLRATMGRLSTSDDAPVLQTLSLVFQDVPQPNYELMYGWLPELWYAKSLMTQALLTAEGESVDEAADNIALVRDARLPQNAPDWAITRFETEIPDIGTHPELPLDVRRQRVLAHFRGIGSTLARLHLIANSWNFGEVDIVADPEAFTLYITFVDVSGVPGGVEDHMAEMRRNVQAHIDIVFQFRFLLWGDPKRLGITWGQLKTAGRTWGVLKGLKPEDLP